MFLMVQKLWLTVVCAVCVTVSFLYFVSLYSYEKLYVDNLKASLVMEGKVLLLNMISVKEYQLLKKSKIV